MNAKLTKKRNNIYDWFEIGILLNVTGGFLDAYTYLTRGGVFANAQTGNLIFMCLNFVEGKGVFALRFLIPVCAFMLGVFVALLLKHTEKFDSFYGMCGVTLMEILLLVGVGFVDSQVPDMLVNSVVSMVAAMQYTAFREMQGLPMTSAFCTGNLRSATECLYDGFVKKQKHSFLNALCYFGLILSFCIGVAAGAWLTSLFHMHSVWFAAGVLAIILLYSMFFHAYRKKRKNSNVPDASATTDDAASSELK